MKQVLVRSGNVFLKEVPAPTVGPKNILVSVNRSCISIGTEVAGIKMSGLPLYKRALKQPHHVKRVVQLMRDHGIARVYRQVKTKLDGGLPAGYSASGTVVEVGSQVSGFQVGDRVACGGAGIANHAELIDVPVNLAVHIPGNLDFDRAASVTLGAIALQGLRRAKPTLGETFVVIGLGILGQITAQLLKANGCHIIGTDLDSERVEIARQNGLDIGVIAAGPELVDAVMKITDGHGADGVIITAVSQSSQILSDAFNLCRKKARVVIVGDVGLDMARDEIYNKELDVLISCSYGPGRYDQVYEEEGQDYPFPYVRWTENRNMAEYLQKLASGTVSLDNMLEEPFPIEEAVAAYNKLSRPGRKPLLTIFKYPEEAGIMPRTLLFGSATSRLDKVNVAIVGAGEFAQGTHLPNLVKLKQSVCLHTIVSRTGLSAQRTAERFGAVQASTDFDAVLSNREINLVLIASRHDLHAPMVLQALRAGKNVFVEKPLALTAEQIDEIEEYYKNTSSAPLLMTGFNRRFAPAIDRIRMGLANRKSPIIVNYRMNAGYLPSDHWVHGEQGGGRNLGEACHIYDLFSALTGSMPVDVYARSINSGGTYWRADDNFVATIRYEDGSVCTLTYTSLGAKSFAKEQVEVFADGTVWSLDDYKRLDVFGVGSGWRGRIDKGHKQELEALIRALQSGSGWPISLAEQLATSRVALAVEQQLAA